MAISTDMTFWINTLIFNKLADICPSLSLNGEDRRVYDICCKDFKNYLLYLNNNHMKVDNAPTQEMTQEALVSMIIGGDLGGVYQSLQSTKEVSEFLDVWISWWWRKWTQRTKIVLIKDDIPKTSISADMGLSSNGLSSEERDELTMITIDKLVQYGEICCTQIIAEALIKKAVEDMKSSKPEDKIRLISKLQRQAREMSYTHGPLIFLRPDNYFKLREWRNDGTTDKII